MNEAPPRRTVPAATIAPAFSETLPRNPESAAIARHMVREALRLLGLSALTDAATLVMSELVANAADHARGGSVRVTVTRTRTRACRVRIAVVDRDPHHHPKPRPAVADDDRGRGLVLVEATSDVWGVHLLRWGKRVWADLEAE